MQSKSKKGGPSKAVTQPPQPKVAQNVQQPIVQQPIVQPNLFSNSNAQQQMASNVQQPIFQFPQQQNFPVQQAPQNLSFPVQTGNMNNAMFQQQQQVPFLPPQMSTNNNFQQQQVRGGMYGRRNVQNPNSEKQPDVFNDDEALIERVKEEKKDAKI